jgi:hypothetical protein
MIHLWPQTSIELRSPLTPEEGLQRLKTEMKPECGWPKPFAWSKLWRNIKADYESHNKFPGTITGSEFEFYMRGKRVRDASSIVNGTIMPSEGGSIVRAGIKFPTIWVMFVYFALVIFFLLMELKTQIASAEAHYGNLAGLVGMFVFGVIVVIHTHHSKLSEAKVWLCKVLNAQEVLQP